LRLHNRKINTLTNNIRLYYGVRDWGNIFKLRLHSRKNNTLISHSF
jgi:hypothetical protein